MALATIQDSYTYIGTPVFYVDAMDGNGEDSKFITYSEECLTQLSTHRVYVENVIDILATQEKNTSVSFKKLFSFLKIKSTNPLRKIGSSLKKIIRSFLETMAPMSFRDYEKNN